ncbi:FAD-dependent monooxygenase [Kitasatospora sp. NPDC101157]|uniref:FAD-dependent monooxygenase n=1 Tax=Kitasatospora sp. NPDC101157 TaxID=3364098 RepID=UPI00380F25A7
MVDVIVVGGGPVGMLLAAELRLHDVEVVVLEKQARPSPHSRAFRLQPRTMEMLDYRGLAQRFRDGHKDWPMAHFAGLQPLLRLDGLESEHAYSLLIPQAETERLLAERAAELGVTVRRGHALTGLSQDEQAVRAEVVGPDGPYTLRADYLVGCDGGAGTVRKAAGFAFPGTSAQVSALLGDVVLEDPAQLPTGIPGTARTPRGLLMAVALEPPVTRVLTTEFRAPQAAGAAPVTVEELRAAIERVTGEQVAIREARWLSRFGDATRLVEEYRRGRVLLAGDAAHIHFPIGAQGLNLGLQEAMNLGWKLAAEVRGEAPEGLLDSYHRERHPVAVRVLRETRAQLALMNPDERTDPLRELVAELLAIPQVNRHLAGLVAGTDTCYADQGQDHPWVGRPAPRLELKAEDGREVRIAELLNPGRAVLLALAAPPAVPLPRGVDLVTATAATPPDAQALLIRPDGHVAWAGAADDPALTRALETWCGRSGRREKGNPMEKFTLDDVRRVIRSCAGENDTVDLDGDIADVPFAELGYDSLALLETAAVIEREYEVELPEGGLYELETPGRVVDFVNGALAVRS